MRATGHHMTVLGAPFEADAQLVKVRHYPAHNPPDHLAKH
jgi:hypothetical protein